MLTFTILLLISCSNSKIEESQLPTVEALSKIDFTEKNIVANQYTTWLKNQRGITFDEAENDNIHIAVLYKPLSFEVAISGGYASDTSYASMRQVKSGNHYIRLQWWDKNQSVVNPTDKKKTFKTIQDNLIVVQNDRDTIAYNSEIISASLLNQPNEILLIIPYDSLASSLRCTLKGNPFGIRDLRLSVTKKQLESFPEIKK